VRNEGDAHWWLRPARHPTPLQRREQRLPHALHHGPQWPRRHDPADQPARTEPYRPTASRRGTGPEVHRAREGGRRRARLRAAWVSDAAHVAPRCDFRRRGPATRQLRFTAPRMERLWSRAGATGGNRWQMLRRWNQLNSRKALPWVATGCRDPKMVRRGSMVRVRQRGSKTKEIPANRLGLLSERASQSTSVSGSDCGSQIPAMTKVSANGRTGHARDSGPIVRLVMNTLRANSAWNAEAAPATILVTPATASRLRGRRRAGPSLQATPRG
jgi:hypothetical protein